MSNRKNYIACASNNGEIDFYGMGHTPSCAIDDFTSNDHFIDHCHFNDIQDESYVKVFVYRIAYKDSPEAKGLEDLFEEGRDWIVREQVALNEFQCLY